MLFTTGRADRVDEPQFNDNDDDDGMIVSSDPAAHGLKYSIVGQARVRRTGKRLQRRRCRAYEARAVGKRQSVAYGRINRTSRQQQFT